MESLKNQLKNPKLINKNDIRDDISELISDDDIIEYFGEHFKKKIVKYSDLDEYKTIDDLLPNSEDFAILLVESNFNSGHWIALLKYDNIIEIFNSYGGPPGEELQFVGKKKNNELEQFEPYLNQLLDKALQQGKQVIYNKVKLQKLKQDYNTCGRWCIIRCIMLKDFDMNLKVFLAFIKKMQKIYKLTGDELVSLLIPKD